MSLLMPYHAFLRGELCALTLSTVSSDLLDEVHRSWTNDPILLGIILDLQTD